MRAISLRWLAQPVFRLILAGFVIVTLVPLTIVSVQTYNSAWDNAWREITEKHRLLALNLSSPISIYINDHVDVLSHLAAEISRSQNNRDFNASEFVAGAFPSLRGFRSLALVENDGVSNAVSHRKVPSLSQVDFSSEVCFIRTKRSGKPDISQVKISRFDGMPTVVLTEPVLRSDGSLLGVVLAELKLDVIEALRKRIRFGEKGHSAIVDAHGKVVAHPNPKWMTEMRKLSHLSVVQKMMRGETGVTEFYSPFIKQQMVAGYTSVPGIGWGVMVPQPKREIEAQVRSLLFSHFKWVGLALLLAMGIAIQIARWITRPLNRFSNAAQLLTKQNFEGELPDIADTSPREVKQLGAAFRDLVTGLQKSRDDVNELNRTLQSRVKESTKELIKANEQLEVLARADHLTELFNRRFFEFELSNLIEDAKLIGSWHALLYMDLDRFKLVNDNYGHEAGDELLRQYAGLLKANVRHGSDIVARIGGDEFAILLKNCPYEEALRIANKLKNDVSNMPFRWEQDLFRLTVSIGIVPIDSKTPGISDVMRLADRCCHAAKLSGRDRIRAFELEKPYSDDNGSPNWLNKLSDALKNDGLVLYHQPILKVNGGGDSAQRNYEILVRYLDNNGSLALPDEFLPTAERFNLMPQIDRWVVQTAMNWLKGNSDSIDESSLLFVNLSAQSLNDKEFTGYLLDKFAESKLPAHRFCFEITETEVLTSLTNAKKFMCKLKDIGCKFALDDFGTGMSSFIHIRELPIDVLKIDGMFVSNMEGDDVDTEIVRSMVEIGHALNLQTVAESVENETIMQHAVNSGVDYVQGNGIQPPRPLADLSVDHRSIKARVGRA